MSVSWVTRQLGVGGTTAFDSQKEAVEQYGMYLGGTKQADLFRVSHDGDIGDSQVRNRVEHAVFELPDYVPTTTLQSPGGILVEHVLSSTSEK